METFCKETYLDIGKPGQQSALRIALTARIFRLGRDQQWSNFPIPWQEISPHQAFLYREGNDYRIYAGDGRDPQKFTLAIRGKAIDKENGYLLRNGDRITVGDPERMYLKYVCVDSVSSVQSNLQANKNTQHTEPFESSTRSFILPQQDITIGDASADLWLNSASVMPQHAKIERKRNRYWLKNINRHSTFVNEKYVRNKVRLRRGDVIRIGPYLMLFSPKRLDILTSGNRVQISAHQMTIAFGHFRNHKTVLNDINLSCQTGEFIALVGSSGAGKSTLMKTLLGMTSVASGQLLINGHTLKNHFNLYRTGIGYVPQDDIIHENLTVQQVLKYACQLRLPPRSPTSEILHRVLQQVDMTSVRKSLVGELSGGQRKRVSIAVELLSDPQILFLDEPTSGLDPGLDLQMMGLLRRIANQGHLVVLVTHATENINVCDRIAFIGPGGHLCYFGPPKSAVSFFKPYSLSVPIHGFTDIYQLFENDDNQVDIAKRIAMFWQAKYVKTMPRLSSSGHPNNQLLDTIRPNRPQALMLRQLIILSHRYLRLILRDFRSFLFSMFTAPVAIALMKVPLPDDEPFASITGSLTQAPLALKTLFVITCAVLWVGLSSSIQEIVKESSIYARERLINLGLLTYVGSKLLIFSLLALGQVSLIVWAILRLFESPSSPILDWPLGLGITTFLTLVSASSLGLLMSAIADNEADANSFLPLVLLPQIIFSGVLFDLPEVASKVSWLTISRWSMGAYGALVNVNAMVPESKVIPGITLPPSFFEINLAYASDSVNLLTSWCILFVQTAIYASLTIVVQGRKDIS